jgi:hypothetical protein
MHYDDFFNSCLSRLDFWLLIGVTQIANSPSQAFSPIPEASAIKHAGTQNAA